jgi:hypothetical protein
MGLFMSSMKGLMVEHIELTIDYTKSSKKKKGNGSKSIVADLMENISKWEKVVGERNKVDWSKLLTDHTVAVKNLIDLEYGGTVSSTKEEIMNDILLNASKIEMFWKERMKLDIKDHWKKHLKCTTEYIEMLKVGNKEGFKESTRNCIKLGRKFEIYVQENLSESVQLGLEEDLSDDLTEIEELVENDKSESEEDNEDEKIMY